MPELPEVETIAKDLAKAGIINSKIEGVEVRNRSTIGGPSVEAFRDRLLGNAILKVSRRGKWLVLSLQKGFLLIHLRMTGRFNISLKKELFIKHEHIVLDFTNGMQLRFHDTRKFGRWYLVDSPEEITCHLGPEPFEWNAADFTSALKSKNRQLKPLLLDQEFIAGLGNIYVDEALWEAKLHPQAVSSTISPKQAESLFKAIQKVLQRGIDTSGTSLGNGQSNYYRLEGTQGKHQTKLNVFRLTNKPCKRCRTLIKRIVVAQRSTHFCPYCQAL